MANKNKLKSHNKNKNHNHNEILIHMTDKKTKPRRRKKTTRKPRDATIPYQTFQPAPVPIYTNRPQYLETVTQAQRENPVSSTVRENDQVPAFSDSTPVQSRTFSDSYVYNSPYLSPKSEYTPKAKVEPMTPLHSKSSFEMPYKPFMDNSPIQSPGSFEENSPMTTLFRNEYAQEAYDRAYNMQENYRQKKASEIVPKIPKNIKADDQIDASEIVPIIPNFKKFHKKVDESLLTDAELIKRAKKAKLNKVNNA